MKQENPENQHKKQNYDWLKGYQYVKGQSGNPKGRPPGKSLKTFAREFLENLPDDEKVIYLKSLPEDLVWKMAEGNPETKIEAKVDNSNKFTEEQLRLAEEIIAKHISDTTPKSSIGETKAIGLGSISPDKE